MACRPPLVCTGGPECDGKLPHSCRECGVMMCGCSDCYCTACPCPDHPWNT